MTWLAVNGNVNEHFHLQLHKKTNTVSWQNEIKIVFPTFIISDDLLDITVVFHYWAGW